MERIYALCLKLLGIYALFGFFSHIPLIAFATTAESSGGTAHRIGLIGAEILVLVFAFLLLFKTALFTRWGRMEEAEAASLPPVEGFLLAKIGFALLGLFFLVTAGPALLADLGELIAYHRILSDRFNPHWGEAASHLVMTGIGFILAGGAGRFARVVVSAKKEPRHG